MKITVPMVPPSGNVLRRTYRNPHAYKRLRDCWKDWIWAWAGSSVMEGRAQVKIHVEHGRFYDQDNLVAGCKPILDSLKTLRMIKDDSPGCIELIITQAKSRERRTTIEVNPA